MHSIVIMDDHTLAARGLASVLGTLRSDSRIRVVDAWEELRWSVDPGCPDVVVAYISQNNDKLLDALGRFTSQCQRTRWLAIVGCNDPMIAHRARAKGAHGVVHMCASPAAFNRAITCLLSGEVWFESAAACLCKPSSQTKNCAIRSKNSGMTPRQGEVLNLVLRGHSNKRIALALSISESTVKEHVTGILSRLGVKSRIELIALLHG